MVRRDAVALQLVRDNTREFLNLHESCSEEVLTDRYAYTQLSVKCRPLLELLRKHIETKNILLSHTGIYPRIASV